MKLERIRGCGLFPSLSLLKNNQWTLPLKSSYSFFYKSFLLFLFSFSSLPAIYGEKTPTLDKNQLRVNEIKAISNPHERAIQWIFHVYHISNNEPQIIKQQAAITESLWTDDYAYKEGLLLFTQAEVHRIQGKHNKATNNILSIIKTLENTHQKTPIENKLLSLAYVTYARLSKYIKAEDGLPFGYKGLDLAISINYPSGEVLARNQIGMIVGYNQNDFTLALEHFIKAKELLPQLPPYVFEAINGFVLGNIAKAWSDLGDIEKSISYKLQLLKEEEKNIKNIELLSGIYNNLGTNYFDLKKYDLAEAALKKTLKLMEQHQLLTHKGIPLLRLGLIQLHKGRILEASTYADAIDFWLRKHQFIGNYEVSFYQFKSKIAKARLDFEQANYWLEEAATEQEAMDQIANANNLVKLETSNKLREIEQERILLEKERELNQATINLQKLLLIGIGFITVLSIWFGITFYEKNKEVTEAYDYILSQSNEKKSSKKSAQKIAEDQTVSVSKDIDEALKQKIIHSLSVNKSFLSPDLTLKKFADLVESNTSYVSQTINVGFEKNFNALINEYRIEEVLRLFHEGQHQTFTIESIYQKAGFKSKSSFQKAFKAKTGVTATHYLNHIS